MLKWQGSAAGGIRPGCRASYLHLESQYGYSRAAGMESAMGASAFIYGFAALDAGLLVLAHVPRKRATEPDPQVKFRTRSPRQ